MNKRLEQLAELATDIVETVNPQGYSSSYAKFDREMFALLIIRECADCVDFYTSDGNGPASDVILNHFGVNE